MVIRMVVNVNIVVVKLCVVLLVKLCEVNNVFDLIDWCCCVNLDCNCKWIFCILRIFKDDFICFNLDVLSVEGCILIVLFYYIMFLLY